MSDNTLGNENAISPGAGRDKASLNPGDTLGQYKVVRLLGRGGMGEVYEVEHNVLHVKYALKLLPCEFAARADALEHFKRETRVMANLAHPCIITVDDFGKTPSAGSGQAGRCRLRMELAEGRRWFSPNGAGSS